MDFKEASDEFLDYVEITRSNGTYDVYKCKLNVLNKYFKGRSIEEIDKKDLVKFWTWRRETFPNIKPQTLNKYRTILNLMLEYHTDKRLKLPKIKEERKLTEIIDPNVMLAVMNYLQSQSGYKEALRNLILFKLLIDTGLRINELLNL